MARKLASPTLSRLGVSRDLEIENKAIITGLGLVAEMNLVETRTGGGYFQGDGTRTGGGDESGGNSDWWRIFAGRWNKDRWRICDGGV